MPMIRTIGLGTVRVGAFFAMSGTLSRRISETSSSQRNRPGGDEALTAGFGLLHRGDVGGGDVPDVDPAESDPGNPGHAVEQALDAFEREGIVIGHDRTEDGAGIDHREFLLRST